MTSMPPGKRRCDYEGCEQPGTTHRLDAPFCAEHATQHDAWTRQHTVYVVEPPNKAEPKPHHTLTSRIRDATDAEIETLIAFFDAPQLRKHYTGLLREARTELARRARAPK